MLLKWWREREKEKGVGRVRGLIELEKVEVVVTEDGVVRVGSNLISNGTPNVDDGSGVVEDISISLGDEYLGVELDRGSTLRRDSCS